MGSTYSLICVYIRLCITSSSSTFRLLLFPKSTASSSLLLWQTGPWSVFALVLGRRWCTSSEPSSAGRRSARCTRAASKAWRTCPRWSSCTRPPSCTTSSCGIRRTTSMWVAFLRKLLSCSKQTGQNKMFFMHFAIFIMFILMDLTHISILCCSSITFNFYTN